MMGRLPSLYLPNRRLRGGVRSIATFLFLSWPSPPKLFMEESQVERWLDDDNNNNNGATIVLAARSAAVGGGRWQSCAGCLVR